MKEFFASLYEWFGFIHLYSKDLGDYLRGWDFACTGYFAVPWYLYIGWIMVVVTTIIYALQYDLVSPTRFSQRQHWVLVALFIVAVNFITAFTIPLVTIHTGAYCHWLKLSVFDCMGFGLSVAIWSFLLFIMLSGIEPLRSLIISWRNPTFKKP